MKRINLKKEKDLENLDTKVSPKKLINTEGKLLLKNCTIKKPEYDKFQNIMPKRLIEHK